MASRPASPSSTSLFIPQYFAEREVFITGATGFVGKVLVERLLWTCPGVSRIHLLMRPKKDMSPTKRLTELKESALFDVIRSNCPERLSKLSVVNGDVTKYNFNMNREDLQRLNQVSIVFHSAATVKFDEPLPTAVEQNVRSVLELLNICDQLPLIKVLVYVSTAYSNHELTTIEERVYPATTSPAQLLTLVDNLPEHIFADITPKLIHPKPNTYTFTKAVAESLIADQAHTLNYATAIVRPSIVISSLQNPFPGWIDSFNGLSGVIAAVAKGSLHVFNCNGIAIADLIPVDIVADTLIASAWEAGIDDFRETRVYNCSSYDNPTTWHQFQVRILRIVCEHPYDSPMWYPFIIFTKSKLLLRISEWLFQIIPLHTMDFLCTKFGIKQRVKLAALSRRMQAMNKAYKVFVMREWRFTTDNVKQLGERLSAADAAIYNIKPHTIDWEAQCMNFAKGVRKFLLKESDKDTNKGHSRIRKYNPIDFFVGQRIPATRLYVIHRLTQCLIVFVMYRLTAASAPAILQIVFTMMATWRKTRHKKIKNF